MVKAIGWQKKFRFYFGLAIAYCLSVAFIGYALAPQAWFNTNRVRLTNQLEQPPVTSSKVKLIDGLPVRLVIPSDQIDIPLDQGYYDPSTGNWNLSGYDGQFAMFSTLANNVGGDTFLYGHNNDFVFGALRHHTPPSGALALLYTSNGHIFSYSFDTVSSVAPDDTSVLNYSGPPIMTIQTCTGSLNEWRTMYKFSFSGVVQ